MRAILYVAARLAGADARAFSNDARASLVIQLVVVQLFQGAAQPGRLRATLQLRRGADGRFQARFVNLPPGIYTAVAEGFGESGRGGPVIARSRGTGEVRRNRTLVLRLSFLPT